jgi:hypothetical protein
MAIDPETLRRIMAALGRKGGRAKSKAKTEAARRNAKQPRRCKSDLCAKCGCLLTEVDKAAQRCTQCGTTMQTKRR